MRSIALGFACNNACIFCAQGELRTKDKPAAVQERTLDAHVAEFLQSIEPGEVIAFVGGEPTLQQRLPAWIEAAVHRGARRILVQTNGRRLAYRAYAQTLRQAPREMSSILSLDVSLHGSTEPMHDYHTSVPGSFRQTVLGIRNACAEGIDVSVTVVVTRSNFRHLGEIVAVAHRAGAGAVRFAPVEPYGSAARAADRVIPAWELVKPHLVHAVAEARRLGLGVVLGDGASSHDMRDRFAGTGEVEEIAVAPREPVRTDSFESQGAEPRTPPTLQTHSTPPMSSSGGPDGRRVSLTVLGRPVPGRQEIRARAGEARRTGEDLKTIFPALFGAAGGAG